MAETRTPGRVTPGRRRNANKENVYFEPGKFGRKTGITLRDTGVRDEHGFEPVSGIFSSPYRPSPVRQSPERAQANGPTDGTSDVPQLGRTPRLPPRSPGPRRTNIGGSPVRHSSVKPTSPIRIPLQQTPSRSPNRSPNRVLTYDDEQVVNSIEKSPAVVMSRSAFSTKTGKPRKSLFDFDLSPEKTKNNRSSPIENAIEEVARILEDNDDEYRAPTAPMTTISQVPDAASLNEDYAPPMMDDDFPDPIEMTEQQATPVTREHADSPNTKRKRGRPRRSDLSEVDTSGIEQKASQVANCAPEKMVVIDPDLLDGAEPTSSVKRRRVTIERRPSPHDSEIDAQVAGMETSPVRLHNFAGGRADSSDVSNFEAPLDEPEEVEVEEEPQEKPQKRSQGRKQKLSREQQAAKTRQVNSLRASERTSSETGTDSTFLPHGGQRLRSNTPFDDEGAKITRSGRASIKPLAYWKNESKVYRHGELEGVVRAQELTPEKRPRKKRKTVGQSGLGRISEQDEEAEDLLPEAWEDELGVIKAPIRYWDADMQAGSVTDEVDEDVAFAARSIVARDVQGSAFRYAKVITMDFFGAGSLEIPPDGFKRSKNARKMQMCFFVHEGKVTVDVAGTTFGLTVGGVFQVPRGNNYAIANESSTYPAKLFFAQGCEPEPVLEELEDENIQDSGVVTGKSRR